MPRSRWIEGSATFTIVPSIVVRNAATPITPATRSPRARTAPVRHAAPAGACHRRAKPAGRLLTGARAARPPRPASPARYHRRDKSRRRHCQLVASSRPPPAHSVMAPGARERNRVENEVESNGQGAPPGEDELRHLITVQLAAMCGVPPSEVDPDRPLDEHGLSSRDTVALAGYLEMLLDRPLPPTLVWEYPTVNGLASALAGAGPAGRWEAFDDGSPAAGAALASVTRRAGALGDVAGFDAAFFGIPPAEAAAMDPQQRILLEVCWESLEHAGLPPRTLRGSRAGVFAGIGAAEYAHLTTADLGRIDAWTATGAAGSVAAGRISYLLDLRGPSLAVDTACSSSLLAVHLAVASLRRGESDLALAGGVNLLLSPVITMTFDAGGGTSPDGRCRPFDAAANGMVRGEGCGVVVLKRLPDAVRDGDRVLAVITGTPLGDPIEARALGEVLGAARPPGRPLLIGSVKSNVGHLEAAAGIAGLIKAVLAVHHRQIPATLHFTAPSPHIPLPELGLDVVSSLTPWPDNPWRPAAGASAFGFSGTNVHVVVTAAPAEDGAGHGAAAGHEAGPGGAEQVATATSFCPLLFSLTDTSAERVAGQARVLADWLGGPASGEPLERIAGTLGERQGRGPHRAVVLAGDRAELSAALRALAAGEPHPGVAPGLDGRPGPGVAFVFSGYGSHWAGMGQALAATEPVFAGALAELEAPLRDAAGFSLRQVLGDAAALRDVRHAQPALFAVQVALARAWEEHGIRPVAVIGHSMGEVAAAVVSGALTVADGAQVIAARSRLLARLAGAGTMALVGLPADETTKLAAGLPGVHLAVISSPVQCVVTGDAAQVAELARRVSGGGGTARVLQAEGAGHSPQVDPLLGELTAALAGLRPRPAGLRCSPTALDAPRAAPVFDAAYWAANLRQPVRLAAAVAAAARDGLRAFTEVSPHPLLARAVTDTLRYETGGPGVVAGTLRRDAADARAFHAQLARLAAGGVRLPRRRRGTLIDLPPAPWRHVPHWAAPAPRPAPGHPLLGPHTELPGGGHAWARTVTAETLADLGTGPAVLGLAAAAEMALAAACEAWGAAAADVTLTRLAVDRLVPASPGTSLTTTLDESGTVRIHLREPGGPWALAATARATHRTGHDEIRTALPGPAAQDAGAVPDDQEPAGPAATEPPVAVPPASGRARGQRIPAVVLGACLAAAATGPDEIPVAADLLRVSGDAAAGGRCTVRRSGSVGVRLAGGPGMAQLLEVRGIRLARVPAAAIPVPYRDKIFEVAWEPRPLPPGAEPSGLEPSVAEPSAAEPSGVERPDGQARRWVLLGGDRDGLAGRLAGCLRGAGYRADLADGWPPAGDAADPPAGGAAGPLAGDAAGPLAGGAAGPLAGGAADPDPPAGGAAGPPAGASAGNAAGPPAGAVLLAPPGPVDPEAAQRLVLDAARLAASLAGGTRLWLVTSGAVAARPGEAGEPGLAALRGLDRAQPVPPLPGPAGGPSRRRIPDHRRLRRPRPAGRPLAGRPRRRPDRAERPQRSGRPGRPGRAGRHRHRGPGRHRGHCPAGGGGAAGRRRAGGRHAAVRDRARGRGVRRRHGRRCDPGGPRQGVGTQGGGRLAAARGHRRGRRRGPGLVRAVLLGRGAARFPGPGRLRHRQRLAGRLRRVAAGPRAPRGGGRLGRVGGRRRGGRGDAHRHRADRPRRGRGSAGDAAPRGPRRRGRGPHRPGGRRGRVPGDRGDRLLRPADRRRHRAGGRGHRLGRPRGGAGRRAAAAPRAGRTPGAATGRGGARVTGGRAVRRARADRRGDGLAGRAAHLQPGRTRPRRGARAGRAARWRDPGPAPGVGLRRARRAGDRAGGRRARPGGTSPGASPGGASPGRGTAAPGPAGPGGSGAQGRDGAARHPGGRRGARHPAAGSDRRSRRGADRRGTGGDRRPAGRRDRHRGRGRAVPRRRLGARRLVVRRRARLRDRAAARRGGQPGGAGGAA